MLEVALHEVLAGLVHIRIVLLRTASGQSYIALQFYNHHSRRNKQQREVLKMRHCAGADS